MGKELKEKMKMVKRTGATKESTRKVVALLEKAGRKGKSAIWLDLAERLKKRRRQRPTVNLWKLDKMAGIFRGKSLLVPGKVLAKGSIGKKANVIALEFSQSAREKIQGAGGKAITLKEALEKKASEKDIIIVK